MSTTLENLTETLTTSINDQVTLNLVDAGLDPAKAYKVGHAPYSLIEDVEMNGAEVVVLDPIFDEVNLDTVPWDKLQF